MTTVIPLTLPEARRLLLLTREPPSQRQFHLWWSDFRRAHQATARRCHSASRVQEQPIHEASAVCTPLASTTRDLDDALWSHIAAILPVARRRGDQPPVEYRTLLAGILWVAQTGASWQDLPPAFGPWAVVKAAYYRWKQHGHWPQVLTLLQESHRTIS